MKNLQYRIALPIIIEGSLFSISIKTLFHACGPKDDGSFMKCHWSEQAVFAFTLAILFTGIVCLFLRSRDQARGLALSLLPIGALIILLSNKFIGICKMATMHCHTVFLPASTVIGIITLATGLLIYFISATKKQENQVSNLNG